MLLLLTTAQDAAGREGPRRVLLIHSFGRDFSPFAEVAARFRTRLAERSPEPVEFIDAPLEMGRLDGGERALLEMVMATHAGMTTDEFAYDRESHVGKLAMALDEAPRRGWQIVSMKHDRQTVYPD